MGPVPTSRETYDPTHVLQFAPDGDRIIVLDSHNLPEDWNEEDHGVKLNGVRKRRNDPGTGTASESEGSGTDIGSQVLNISFIFLFVMQMLKKDSELPADLADVDLLDNPNDLDDVFHPPNDVGEAVGLHVGEEQEAVGRHVGEEQEAGGSHARIIPPRVMVFTTLNCLALLAMCTDIFLDGTFKVKIVLLKDILRNIDTYAFGKCLLTNFKIPSPEPKILRLV